MRWVRYIAIAIVNGFGVVIGIIWIAVPTTVAQPSLNYQLALSGRQPEAETPQSLSVPASCKRCPSPSLARLRSRVVARDARFRKRAARALSDRCEVCRRAC